MSDYKSMLKKGWHTENKGQVLKNQMKGLMNRGEKQEDRSQQQHASRPLTALRDPSSFSPPPKHIATGGPGARGPGQSPAPLSPRPGTASQYGSQPGQAAEPDEPPAPPRPYRVDTTGLSTAHLPPPPIHHARSPSPAATRPPPSTARSAPPPSLPPRLPPRASPSPAPSTSTSASASAAGVRPPPLPAPAHPAADGYLNAGSISRLSAAGVSVPSLGIGGGGAGGYPAPPPRPSASSPEREVVARAGAEALRTQQPTALAGLLAAKKKPAPPPPPKKKKPELAAALAGRAAAGGQAVRTHGGEGEDAPPPLPMATKPRF